jgi:hypothetical protein
MRDLFEAVCLVLVALALFFGGAVLWREHEAGMRLAFACLGCLSFFCFLVGMTMGFLSGVKK